MWTLLLVSVNGLLLFFVREVESTYIESRVVYEPIKCEDGGQTCPKWNHCDPASGSCQPCGRCLDMADRAGPDAQCSKHSPTFCIPPMYQKHLGVQSCPPIDVAVTGSNRCSGTCRPLRVKITGESPLGTLCELRCDSTDPVAEPRTQRVQCIWNFSSSTAVWNDTLMSGFDQILPTSPMTTSNTSSSFVRQDDPGDQQDFLVAIVVGCVVAFFVVAAVVAALLLVVKRCRGGKTLCQILKSRPSQDRLPDNPNNPDASIEPREHDTVAMIRTDEEPKPTAPGKPGEGIAPSDDDDVDDDIRSNVSTHSSLLHRDRTAPTYDASVASRKVPCQHSEPSSLSVSSENLSQSQVHGYYSTQNPALYTYSLPMTTDCFDDVRHAVDSSYFSEITTMTTSPVDSERHLLQPLP